MPDSRVDFHRCGNNFGTSMVSMPEFSHKPPPRWEICPASDLRRLRRLGEDVAGTGVLFTADEIPGTHRALALDLHITALLKDKVIFQPAIHVLGHLNPPDRVGGFHPRRNVDRIAPHVVEEPA